MIVCRYAHDNASAQVQSNSMLFSKASLSGSMTLARFATLCTLHLHDKAHTSLEVWQDRVIKWHIACHLQSSLLASALARNRL